MDVRDRHNGLRDKRTNGRTDEQTRRVFSSVRPSLRWSLTLCAHMVTRYVCKISLLNSMLSLLNELQKIKDILFAAPCIVCLQLIHVCATKISL